MNLKRIILILLGLGLLVGFYIYAFVLNKEHPDFEDLKADYVMTAEQLYNEFVNNSEAASTKYNGKMIELTEQAHSVEMADSLTIAVFVFNEGMFGDEGIRCTFLNENAKAITNIENLKGKNIKGFCAGFNDTDVILDKCSLTN